MKNAFTMAEILLSLTIIGVVAAITLPSLTGNINERTWNTQRKALYARFSQAIALMPALNGYGTLEEESSSGAGDAVDTAAETFVTAGLAQVMKINNICDNEHFEDCGIVSQFNNMDGSNISWPLTLQELNDNFDTTKGFSSDIKAAAFETQNGESIAVYYNPSCVGYTVETAWHSPHKKMCANFIYDLNGSKGPNTVGKDIGWVTALYNSDPIVVSPMPLRIDTRRGVGALGYFDAIRACKTLDPDSRASNVNELYSMHFNSFLMNTTPQDQYLYSTTRLENNSNNVWTVNLNTGDTRDYGKDRSDVPVWCIKR